MALALSSTPRGAARVLAWLLAIDVTFFLLYVGIHIFGHGLTWGPLHPFFDLNEDVAIPAWFSSIQLFMTGLLVYLTGRSQPAPVLVPRRLFSLGAAGFVFLSIDEAARIHERITAVARMTGQDWLLIANQGAWIMIYLAAAALIAAVAAPSLLVLWKHLRRETAIAAAGGLVVVAGAIGLEIAGYLLAAGSTAYRLEVAFEELFEMAGVSVMLYAVLLMNARFTSPPGS